MKKPTSMLLEANFDINQIGETLEWKFSRKDGNGNPVKGRYAGAIYFTVGEQMHIRIRAGGYEKFESFQVLDCTLITRPQIRSIAPGVLPEYAPPSPFIDNEHVRVKGASVQIPAEQFLRDKADSDDPLYHKKALKWDKHLTVGACTGRWEVSFVLTVLITRASGETSQRVFVFDPESEVGGGIAPTVEALAPGAASDQVACMPESEVGGGIAPA
ncbi:hypothetical protein [Massilia rubra]|uniref:Uncharacterized protein n=1 Tax=Massilia rubra TaxID=2607910 RepID=A0ABX0LC85_9BURK|nr:hypothetical protein [Massilia rubra]NHZ32488.1 hypothetical protein [Massilia rubra]